MSVAPARLIHLVAALCFIPACAGSDDDDSAASATSPALNRMFRDDMDQWVEDPVAFKQAGGLLYFDDASCWLADRDSFDDFSMPPKIPPGVTPVAGACAADGKATGPLQFAKSHDPKDLLPSQWCRSTKPECTAAATVGEGNYDVATPAIPR